jgi:sugar O-acyltransferase (sialic acid O-acetyltransferase NeuD family)
MKRVVLAGNAVAASLLIGFMRKDERDRIVAATVHDAYVEQSQVEPTPTVPLSRLAETHPPGEVTVLMAVGYGDLNRSREAMFEQLKALGYEIETYIHPAAGIYTDEPIGEGSIVLPGAVIEPYATVGRNTVVWCNVTIAHHAIVSDHCWLAAGAVISGAATVGRNSFVGLNATVLNRVAVGEYGIVGAGALVSRTTEPARVYVAKGDDPIALDSHGYVKRFGFK